MKASNTPRKPEILQTEVSHLDMIICRPVCSIYCQFVAAFPAVKLADDVICVYEDKRETNHIYL